MKNIYFILFASLFLFACEKEEKPVAPASKTALTAGLGSQYENSIYFNVLSGQFVMTVGHELWDLNFTGDPQSHAIFLNSSNFLFAKEMGAVPFETVSDTSGITLGSTIFLPETKPKRHFTISLMKTAPPLKRCLS